jgi:uncharacterized protein YbjT (DUF2867 family)
VEEGRPATEGEEVAMSDKVLVTGGTGTLGRLVVRRLAEAGYAVRLLSRRPQPLHGGPDAKGVAWCTGNLVTGVGLDAALDGVTAVVHCASNPRRWREDVPAARNLADAARRAGSPHLVFISVVGVDRVPFAYYRTKLAVEGLLAGSGVPWSILRATQFHDLIRMMLDGLARAPKVMLVPARTSFQPVDADEVAARLVELVRSGPSGRVPDFGGPEVLGLEEMAASYLRATGRRRRLIAVPLPGALFRGYREGGHLAPGHAEGRRTWGEYLADVTSSQGTAED